MNRLMIANPAAAFMQGQAFATQADDMKRQRGINNVFAEHGAGIAAGDQNALAALAQYDPMAVYGMRRQQEADARANRGEARADELFQMKVAEYKAGLSAAEAAAQAEKIKTAVKVASGAQTPEQWDAAVSHFGATDLVGQFGNKDVLLRQYMSVADILAADAGPKPADEYQRYVQEETAAGREPLDRIGYAQAKKGQGLSITTADGTTITQGGARPPVGQNPALTATPRDGGKLSDELSKDDADYLKSEKDAARAAEELEGLATRLETLAPEVGYTGPGGALYGAIDDAIGVLPGDEGARGAFRSAAVEAQLTFTERTKGAITEREMALFAAAVPNLNQRPEANQFIAQALRAGARRTQTRAKFMERYAAKVGSLEGAEDAWDKYMAENPILEKQGENLVVREEGDWQSYLSGPSPMTPGGEIPDFGAMPPDQIFDYDLDTLSPQGIEAWLKATENL